MVKKFSKYLLDYICVSFFLLGIIKPQELPYGKPKYFDLEISGGIKEIEINIPTIMPQNIFENIEPIQHQLRDYYFLKIRLKNNNQAHFQFNENQIIKEMDIFFINLETNGWVGPYSKKVVKNNFSKTSGGLNTQNILIEISVPIDLEI